MPFRLPQTVFTARKTKPGPLDENGMEANYLKSLGERQTPVAVHLSGGEVMHGWIEYYDQQMVRLTREGQPNLFIYKHDILYIVEDNGRGRKANAR
jgi:host factor-I protein